jgi:hypothetical protein
VRAVVVAAALAIPAAAAAKPSADLTAELREAGAAEAPIVIRLDARALTGLHDLVRSRVPSLLRGGLDAALDQLAAQLGGSPFTDDGWRAMGLEPPRPIVSAAGRTTEPPFATARAATGAILVDVRAIVPVADPAAAARTIARVQTIAPDLVFGPPRRTLSIDLVIPAETATADEIRAARPALLAARSTDAAVAARLRDPTAAALAGTAPLALHVAPAQLADTLLWLRLGRQAATPTPDAIAFVRDLARPLAPILAGPLGTFGASAELRHDTLAVHAAWAVETPSPLATALARTSDSGLPRPSDTPDAALHLHSYVAGLAALDALHASGMTFDLPAEPFFPFGGLSPLVDIVGWPYALGATIAHVETADPRARPIFAGTRDGVLVVQTLGADVDHTAAAFEVAFAPDAAATVRRATTAVYGDGATAGGVTTWGAGRVRVFARTVGTIDTVGAALRDAGDAYRALPRKAPPAPHDLVLELHAAPAALALVSPLAVFAGALDLSARWDGHALQIDATLSPP